MDLCRRSNAYVISVYVKIIQNIPYLVLLPYMESMMSEPSYFHFHLISKSFFSFLFIWSVCFSKIYSEKDSSPNYIEFSNSQKRIGRFVWFQKSYTRKFYFKPCFQLLKVNDLGQFEKSQQVSILKKKKAKHYRQSGKLLFTMLKTLDSYLYMKPNLAKDQELEICNRVYEIAT